MNDTQRLDWLLDHLSIKYVLLCTPEGVGFIRIDSRKSIDVAMEKGKQ